jgi:hypothetical protein
MKVDTFEAFPEHIDLFPEEIDLFPEHIDLFHGTDRSVP